MSLGVDYVTGPPIATLKAARIDGNPISFVCRYLSEVNAQTQIKLLTNSEAKALSEAGIAIVSNYEWYASRATEGYAAGMQDAQIAASQHKACGGPLNRPIYFSVDADVSGEQTADYFRGVAVVIGIACTGAYGSYRVLKYLFDQGLIKWGWQTYAWSYGAWESRAHIQQYNNGQSIDGASVDFNRSIKSDFGQWMIGQGGEVEDMPLLLTDPMGKLFIQDKDNDQVWHCAKTAQQVIYAILAFYRQNQGQYGLPRTSEFKLPAYPNAKFQVFERAILVYNPQHDFDNPPGAGDVFLAHIDGGVGQQVIAKPIVDALNQQITVLKQQLADAQSKPAEDTSTIATLQTQLEQYKQAVASIETQLSALPK